MVIRSRRQSCLINDDCLIICRETEDVIVKAGRKKQSQTPTPLSHLVPAGRSGAGGGGSGGRINLVRRVFNVLTHFSEKCTSYSRYRVLARLYIFQAQLARRVRGSTRPQRAVETRKNSSPIEDTNLNFSTQTFSGLQACSPLTGNIEPGYPAFR